MADTPFFRGPNRIDWLFAVMLQTACDWQSQSLIEQVAEQFSFETLERFDLPLKFGPSVYLVWCTNYVFVSCNSTKTDAQWIGNVLGSIASAVPPSHGTVSSYFGSIASIQWANIRSRLIDDAGQHKIVFIGFSLGGAVATIMRDMATRDGGLSSAGVAFGCPRPGTTSFAAGYDGGNFARFTVVNDVVGSVPPVLWAGTGSRNNWTPLPPFVLYVQPTPGFTLSLPNQITPGDFEVSVTELATSFDTGVWLQFHNQSLYARILRAGLPVPLENGHDGYPDSGSFDSLCEQVFDFSPVGWPWAPDPRQSNPKEEMVMGCQMALYFRDVNQQLGFQEIMYWPGDDPSQGFSQVIGSSGSFIGARAKFLSNSLEIYAARVSRVGGARQSYLKKYVQPAQGLVQQASEKIEPAISYFGYNIDRTMKRQFHFRGIASTWIAADKLTPTGISNSGLITQYLDVLIANNIQLFSKNPATKWPIQSAAKATQSDLITLTLTPAFPGVAAGTVIQIRGCRTAPLLNAFWVVAGVGTSPNIITLSATQNFSAPAMMTGYVRTVVPAYTKFTDYEFNGVTKHATGVPSFRQRGKSSAKIKRR